ncbi:zinc metalloproteinase nas-4-like [Amphibalanus amphitrite]|uniref:zinc metalloproteinase nas-4-like n=1 Tax=Amphibalanus amphitrite TaxID=1232801 RepID=UPI001C8FFE9C|nr:zinc metalloproteinase nas-4-like [Amphibalanus amphitrite]
MGAMDDDVFGMPLSPEDFANAASIADDAPKTGPGMEDPIEMAGLFEGDIAHMDKDMMMAVMDSELAYDGEDNMVFRNAIREDSSLWPNAEIPYLISSSYSKHERAVIAKAVMAFEDNTCIRVVPRTTQKNYIHVRKGSGCSSAVGVIGGAQELSLADGCVYPGVVMHEFMHAAGFWHEQSRGDRDDHIVIHWSNIISGMDYNFHKYPWSRIQHLDEPYDVTSIMHYGPYAFAANRKKPTITPIKATNQMGQRNGFSAIDIRKLNKLYKCQGGGGGGGVTVSTTEAPKPASCEDNNKWCSAWSDRGECTKNPVWMKVNCAKSCGTCKSCSDHNAYCSSWARNGECAKNWSYMSVYCRDSCGLCLDSSGATPSTCTDNNKYCTAWAKDGECTKNPAYMLKDCKKACDACDA